MEKKTFILYVLIGVLAVAITVLSVIIINTKEAPVEKKYIFESEYRIVEPYIPDTLEFCGEIIDREDAEVAERVEREFLVNNYSHSATILAIKRANRWFPVIEPILKKYGIPGDFKYMAVAESGLSNAISPAAAVGFWQLIEPVAKKYGLEVSDQVDERYNVEKATEAACMYLKEAHAKFGNWSLAAASYNMGLTGIQQQLNRQKTENYFDLLLNDETSRFVFRIVAIKYILRNPGKYDFYFEEKELYQPYETKTIKISSGVKNFADFAESHGINYKTLKILNPWLRDSTLTNKKRKTYYIKIPA